MSPLSLWYTNVGSFSNFSLSIYDKYLIPGSSFVALLWIFFIVYICLGGILVTICSMILRSCCSISWSFLFVMALNILMSSANRNVLDLVKSGRLFMYKTNNNGPRTDP